MDQLCVLKGFFQPCVPWSCSFDLAFLTLTHTTHFSKKATRKMRYFTAFDPPWERREQKLLMHVNPITRGTAERWLMVGTGALARRRKSLIKAPTSHTSSGCLSAVGEAILKYNLSSVSPEQGSFTTTNRGSDSTSCLRNVYHTGQGRGPVV